LEKAPASILRRRVRLPRFADVEIRGEDFLPKPRRIARRAFPAGIQVDFYELRCCFGFMGRLHAV
jgi:hypothetical protein